MYKLRNYLLCAAVSILLFFSAAAAEAVIILKNYVLEPSSYHTILKINNVYEKAYNEIKKHYENEENATGIPADVYLDAVTPELVEQIINDNVDSVFSALHSRNGKPDYSSAENRLSVLKESTDKFFDDYARSVNYQKDDVYYQKTESVFREASENILDITDVFQFRKIEKAGYISKAARVLSYEGKFTAAAFAASGLCLLILILANIKKPAGAFYWISISFGSLSAVMLAVCIWLKQSDYFSRFAIKASHIFSAITGTCVYFTDALLLINAVLIAVSVFMMVMFSVFGKEKSESVTVNGK